MIAMGIARDPASLDVWPEHHLTWDVWMAITNAWNVVSGMAGDRFMGFDRSAAESVMRMFGVRKRDRRQTLDELLALEAAALPVLNAK